LVPRLPNKGYMTTPTILKDKYTGSALVLAAVILITAFFRAYINFWDNASLLVIHFDAFQGADFFGKASDVFDIVISGFVVLLINFGLAQALYFRERFLSYLIAFASLVFAVLILFGVNAIISVN